MKLVDLCRYKTNKNTWHDVKWLKHVRMNRASFMKLRDRLRPALRQEGNNHLSVGEQLYTTLYFLAQGGTLLNAANANDVSVSTVSRCIKRVCDALLGLMDQYIVWPTGAVAETQV